MSQNSLSKSYDPHLIEEPIYQRWEEQGCFLPSRSGEPYCIMIPPPNVTGSLHMGHAFQNTLMDALIRYHRMKGRNTLWLVGTDHAGIATQIVVETQLRARGISRSSLGRQAFNDEVWKWKAESGGTITSQLRRLGASVDWSRERFTMEEDLSRAVREVFIKLYEEGLIYRGKRLVNWDPVLLTAISDLEVLMVEETGSLWHFRYPIVGEDTHVVIATTRPETMLGDTAVAVHPDDERYAKLIGKSVELPLVKRIIPIIADDYVDPEFGTGCLKVTPAHDFNDFKVGERNSLDIINIMTPAAKINLPGTPYHELDRFVARKKVVADMEANGLLERVEEHVYNVPHGDRTNQIIEPYLTDQWFVKVGPLAKPAIDAVRNGTIRFVPSNWDRTYFEWMENIEDWCISRQIWWGHRIPAWYDDDNNIFVARSEEEALQQAREKHGNPNIQLKRDEDVLDTWFSSALWPFSTLGWPDQTEDLKTFYTTNVLVTGFDIIFFWVARMIMFGLKFAGGHPFDEVYIHGLVRDAKGQKMSKSKGNILDPLDLIDGIELETLVKKRTTGLMQPGLAPEIEKATRQQFPEGIPAYGADALRLTIASLATQGRNIRFDLKRIEGYRNFCNKLWNAARFVLMNTADDEINFNDHHVGESTVEKWIVSELHTTTKNVETAFEQYRFDLAAHHMYQFVWGEFCDWYIEFAKVQLRDESVPETEKSSIRRTLAQVLEKSLRLFHPFMPFVTEKIWQTLIARNEEKQPDTGTIMLQEYVNPQQLPYNTEAMKEIEWVKAVISGIRNIRAELGVNPGSRVQVVLEHASRQDIAYLKNYESILRTLARLDNVRVEEDENTQIGAVSGFLVDNLRVSMLTDTTVNKAGQLEKLEKEINSVTRMIQQSESKLANDQFVEKAPSAVVDKERQRLSENLVALDDLKARAEAIQNL